SLALSGSSADGQQSLDDSPRRSARQARGRLDRRRRFEGFPIPRRASGPRGARKTAADGAGLVWHSLSEVGGGCLAGGRVLGLRTDRRLGDVFLEAGIRRLAFSGR